MHWLFLLLAFAAMVLAFSTPHTWLLLIALGAGLLLFLAWAYGWYVARAGSLQRDETAIVDPAELRRLREQAETRRRAAGDESASSSP